MSPNNNNSIKSYKTCPEFWAIRVRIISINIEVLGPRYANYGYKELNAFTLKHFEVNLYETIADNGDHRMFRGKDGIRYSLHYNREKFYEVLLKFDGDDDYPIKQLEELIAMMKF